MKVWNGRKFEVEKEEDDRLPKKKVHVGKEENVRLEKRKMMAGLKKRK